MSPPSNCRPSAPCADRSSALLDAWRPMTGFRWVFIGQMGSKRQSRMRRFPAFLAWSRLEKPRFPGSVRKRIRALFHRLWSVSRETPLIIGKPRQTSLCVYRVKVAASESFRMRIGYFPIQKVEKIDPSTSSTSIRPDRRPSASPARRSWSATISVGRP